jgi:hypothetical protein
VEVLMGLSLEFYAGDAATIGADFTAIEFDGLRDGSRARAYADFSLHLSPTHLDLLSEVIAEQVGAAPQLLNDSRTCTVGGFEGEGSADVVNLLWVQMVAAADEADAPGLAAEWIERVAAECGRQLAVTPEAVRAVSNLIRLCQLAKREDLDVVHAWYL